MDTTHFAGQNVQRDLVGDAARARDVEPGSKIGNIANRAIDRGAVELNRSSLEHSLSWCCTSFFHRSSLSDKL